MNQNEALKKYADRMRVFIENRRTFPPQELSKYEDHWVAWSPDGTSIIAATKNPNANLDDLIRAAGYDPSECVHSFVPSGEHTVLGGLS